MVMVLMGIGMQADGARLGLTILGCKGGERRKATRWVSNKSSSRGILSGQTHGERLIKGWPPRAYGALNIPTTHI